MRGVDQIQFNPSEVSDEWHLSLKAAGDTGGSGVHIPCTRDTRGLEPGASTMT